MSGRRGAPVLAAMLATALAVTPACAFQADARAQRTGGEADAGDRLRERGDDAGAAAAYRQALATPDSLTARLRLAELRLESGDTTALDDMDAFIDVYRTAGGRLTSRELAAVARALGHLGRRDPQIPKDALRVYDEAIAADSANLDARVALGELFLDKYNGTDAAVTFDGVLAVDPRHARALVGAARRMLADGDGDPEALVRRALDVDAGYAPAHALAARLRLDVEDHAGAIEAAERALAIDATNGEALAVLALASRLRGDEAGYTAARGRAAGRGPAAAAFHATLAELAARNRLYADAVTYARDAVRHDSAGRGLALLGVNLLRVGDVAGSRAALEAGFRRDPYDVWTKNTLDLLDHTQRSFREVETPHFRLVFDSTEADLLAPYATEIAEEAYAQFARRYGWQPDGPIRLELYPRHADFSVRTVGLAGLGALGVSFGTVLAMDSPAARDAGTFNWGSTLWHEVAHTFTLGASAHRVPRWLSEGLSVYEERKARPGWGADASPAFVAAYAGGRVPPPSRMNDGFMRPDFPQQVLFSYYAASLVAEMIERDAGDAAFGRMLRLYAQGRQTPDVVREVLGVSMEELDRTFDAYVRERLATQLAAVAPMPTPSREAGARPAPVPMRGEFADAMRAASQAIEAGRDDAAIAALERAKRAFPGAGGPESPHWLLAGLHEKRGDRRSAANELLALTLLDEEHYRANVKLADLLVALGDTAGATAALERAVWISPYDGALHARLADRLAAAGDAAGAVRERRAVVALRPTDEAQARYELAVALRAAGDAAGARREVLRALEIAPAFELAQALLLELRAGATP